MKAENKPMSVERTELLSKLYAAINDAKLPLFVIEYIIKDLHEHVSDAAKTQIEYESKYYAAEQEEQKEQTDE